MNQEIASFFPILAGLFGLMLGSFFNVLMYRLPRKESIIWPPSHCPQCGRPIRPLENIPLISYILLRGKCAGCKKRISILYPVIEIVTAVATLLIYLHFVVSCGASHSSMWEIIFLVMQASLLLIVIPVAVIDAMHYIIPDSITLPGLAIAAAVSFFPGGLSPLQCLLGIIAGGGSLFCIGILGEWIFKRGEAMGGGDVKLMALAGAVFGWKISLLAIVFASVAGSVVGGGLIVCKVLTKDRKIPFGPFLAAGLWIAAFFGDALLAAYQSLIYRAGGY